jgi:hypothetical protein
LNAGLLTGFHFLLENRSRRVADIRLTTAELFESTTSTRNTDGHFNRAFFGLLKFLGDGFRNGKDGTRTIDLNDLRLDCLRY